MICLSWPVFQLIDYVWIGKLYPIPSYLFPEKKCKFPFPSEPQKKNSLNRKSEEKKIHIKEWPRNQFLFYMIVIVKQIHEKQKHNKITSQKNIIQNDHCRCSFLLPNSFQFVFSTNDIIKKKTNRARVSSREEKKKISALEVIKLIIIYCEEFSCEKKRDNSHWFC